MKKISINKYISLYREKKRIKRIKKNRTQHPIRSWEREDYEKIIAPETFNLLGKENHRKTTEFLQLIRNSFKKNEKMLVIDLSKTRKIFPAGTLIFYSEICRIKSIKPEKNIRFIKSKEKIVNAVFEHLGIFSLAEYKSHAKSDRDDVVSWRKASSNIADGQAAGELIETYESLSREEIKKIFKGVSEAATNAVEHAYLEKRNDGLPAYEESRWWMFCRELQDKLYVAVCDLGIGIPETLPKNFPEQIVNLFEQLFGNSGVSDSKMIRAAMELARTRTGREERGKGLSDIKTVVDKIPKSELMIFSNRGMILYKNNTFFNFDYERSIMGTVIVWIIPTEGTRDE